MGSDPQSHLQEQIDALLAPCRAELVDAQKKIAYLEGRYDRKKELLDTILMVICEDWFIAFGKQGAELAEANERLAVANARIERELVHKVAADGHALCGKQPGYMSSQRMTRTDSEVVCKPCLDALLTEAQTEARRLRVTIRNAVAAVPWVASLLAPEDADLVDVPLSFRETENERLRRVLWIVREDLRLTQEYVGDGLLPKRDGWSWFEGIKLADSTLAATSSNGISSVDLPPEWRQQELDALRVELTEAVGRANKVEAARDEAYRRHISEWERAEALNKALSASRGETALLRLTLEGIRNQYAAFSSLVDTIDVALAGFNAIAGLDPTPSHLRGDGPCQDCGSLNIVWFTDNVVWNAVMEREKHVFASDRPETGILCPFCFVKRAEDAGLQPTGWRITPEWPWRMRAADLSHSNVSPIAGEEPLSILYELRVGPSLSFESLGMTPDGEVAAPMRWFCTYCGWIDDPVLVDGNLTCRNCKRWKL